MTAKLHKTAQLLFIPEKCETMPEPRARQNIVLIADEAPAANLTDLATNPFFSTGDFKAVPAKYRKLIPDSVKDYVSLSRFVA